MPAVSFRITPLIGVMSLSEPSPSVPTKVMPPRRVKLAVYTDEMLGEEKKGRYGDKPFVPSKTRKTAGYLGCGRRGRLF